MEKSKRKFIKFFFLTTTTFPIFNFLGIRQINDAESAQILPQITQISEECFLIDGWILTKNDLNI